MSGEIQALLSRLVAEARAHHPARPALIGVGGSQGSGKSYQSRLYAEAHPHVAHFSLDDVYLTKAERQARAKARDNPLFATRGPPGTHDMGLLRDLVTQLGNPGLTRIPRFIKAQDDRAPEAEWTSFEGPADVIMIDGWCMGAKPALQDETPLNSVEAEDHNGAWRRAMNDALGEYQAFFAAFDAIIYLQAPSWEIVRVWRGQQEVENLGRALNAEDEARLDRFVAHYERVTRAMLAGHHSARFVAHLDAARAVVRIEER